MLKTILARAVAPLLVAGALAGCVPASQYNALDNDYNQLNQRLSGQIANQQVHITRLQGAIQVTVNSELLFPSGDWKMPPEAAATIAQMAPILVPIQQSHLLINGYTDNTPIGAELMRQGVTSNQQLSMMRAQTVTQFLVSQGVNPNLVTPQGYGDSNPVASNATPEGRAQNRRVDIVIAGPGN
jgi:chemotaxis protein MotB